MSQVDDPGQRLNIFGEMVVCLADRHYNNFMSTMNLLAGNFHSIFYNLFQDRGMGHCILYCFGEASVGKTQALAAAMSLLGMASTSLPCSTTEPGALNMSNNQWGYPCVIDDMRPSEKNTDLMKKVFNGLVRVTKGTSQSAKGGFVVTSNFLADNGMDVPAFSRLIVLVFAKHDGRVASFETDNALDRLCKISSSLMADFTQLTLASTLECDWEMIHLLVRWVAEACSLWPYMPSRVCECWGTQLYFLLQLMKLFTVYMEQDHIVDLPSCFPRNFSAQMLLTGDHEMFSVLPFLMRSLQLSKELTETRSLIDELIFQLHQFNLEEGLFKGRRINL